MDVIFNQLINESIYLHFMHDRSLITFNIFKFSQTKDVIFVKVRTPTMSYLLECALKLSSWLFSVRCPRHIAFELIQTKWLMRMLIDAYLNWLIMDSFD